MNRAIKNSLFNNKYNLITFKCLKSTNIYSKTLNLPNAGNFNLSMKNVYENEENIKKASFFK